MSENATTSETANNENTCCGTQGGCCGSDSASEDRAATSVTSTDPTTSAACSAEGGACGCESTIIAFDGTKPEYIRRLWMVIAINASMFFVEIFGGVLARSQALKADALDFLGDTLTYGMSLAVIGKPLKLRATVAMVKGISLFFMGLWVLGNTLYHTLVLQVPSAPVMGGIALAALAANVASVLLLLPYKDGDANVRSVWLCSRNDAFGNLGVIAASWLVWLTASPWPDIVVAFVMAGLFTHSSLHILKQARAEYAHAAQAAGTT